MKKKILLVSGSFVLLILAFLGSIFLLTFAGAQKVSAGPPLGPRFEKVVDGIATIYIVDLGNSQLALIDAGNDTEGHALKTALEARHKKPEDVVAIFLTHSHRDHIATIPLFPKAVVYASKAEAPLAEGREAYTSPMSHLMGKYNTRPFSVGHSLEDGEKVILGDTTIVGYTLPGHTPGSTAYVIQGALFLGDAANFKSDGTLSGPWWIFSNDAAQGTESLKKLFARLESEQIDVKNIVTAHTGGGQGIGPLKALALK
jgi:glyoxylase-like metal-dependent hydrolase (beta-lactamase superfamily II)